MLSGMQYPYWLMVAGAVSVVLGFIGFVFSSNVEPDQGSRETETNGKE